MHIRKSDHLSGTLMLPPSKSHSIRAVAFASQVREPCVIENLLDSPDVEAAKRAALFGGVIDVGGSGLVLRLFGALAALGSSAVRFFGDSAISNNRPIQPLIEGINGLGGKAKRQEGFVLEVCGPLKGGECTLDGADSQPVSGLLMAAAFAKEPSLIRVKNPGEKAWVALTLSWFDRLQIPYEMENFEIYRLKGGAKIAPFRYKVPGDFSSAAFPLVAAAVTRSTITLEGVDFSDSQGDKVVFHYLEKMGAKVTYQGERVIFSVKEPLMGGTFNLNDAIDLVPAFAALGSYCKTPLKLIDIGIARKKESDRLSAITEELQKMGAKIEEGVDDLTIYPQKLHGAHMTSHKDHRIAMALAVAALGAEGESFVKESHWIEKTYPNFVADFQKLGALIS